MEFAKIISLVILLKAEDFGKPPATLTFCKSPYVCQQRKLNLAISSGLCLSFNFHDREWTSNSVYFRHPLFGLPSLAEGHLCTLRTVRWASSRARPREIRTANENRFDEPAEKEGRDTGNLWHAISHRMKTWCHHVDLAPRRRSGYFIEFSTVFIHARTYHFLFFSRSFHTPWIKVLYVLLCLWFYIKNQCISHNIVHDIL